MEHILDLNLQSEQLELLFKKIKESNTILFLGAGASVGAKTYLSKQIIDYYENELGYTIDEQNITRWVDILSANDDFSRVNFDNFVTKLLQKLSITESHKIMASIPWREIITTNYDLLVEIAYDELKDTSNHMYDLHVIRNQKQLNYKEANNEVKYIKLNGCIQDKSLYPLAFSTDDFDKKNAFYKTVLNELRNLSPEISLLSIGYSFADDFGKQMLRKFDSYNYREKKWLYNVDPFPNEKALAYYKQNRICIIKTSFEDFFARYQEWNEKQATVVVKKKGLQLYNSNEYLISVPPTLLMNLDGIVRQLNSKTKIPFLKDVDFYRGEEPTFEIIQRGVDVVKSKFIIDFTNKIEEVLLSPKGTFIPIFFITGDFGIGKSTFTLRLIHELEKKSELGLVSFEILDLHRLKREILIDLVKVCKSKHLLFYCDEVEIESYFKSVLELQRDLSIEQFQDCNIFFIVPIRENMLEKFKLSRQVKSSYELNLSGYFEEDELSDLLEKLKKVQLVEFRDANEKKQLLTKIIKEYNSDSFLSLMASVTSGRHENDLISSYNQLSKDAQKAFILTALLHKYKLLAPAVWIKHNINLDWDEFIQKVIKAEGKGILIQEFKLSHGTQPDLYFRTKHPLIAEKLIERLVPNNDGRFKLYEQILSKIDIGKTTSYIVNDLLRALYKSEEFSPTQIDKLYDTAFTRLSDDPYFLLNYANNLRFRKTKASLKKAIDQLIYAESLLDRRNHKFIQRRATANFELAKLYFEEEEELNFTTIYLQEAVELFVTKQLMDPFSAFSYVDYVKCLMWQLENIEQGEEDELQKQIIIEDLLDLAVRTVTDDPNKIDHLQTMYAEMLSKYTNEEDHKVYLDSLYEDARLRPYACILLYNYYSFKGDFSKCEELLSEMEAYQHNFEIVKFLFKIYGRELFEPNVRIKMLRLGRQNAIALEKENPLRYNFFHFIAESYNHNYADGKNYLNSIKAKYNNLNPEFHYEWKESNGDTSIFNSRLVKNDNEKYKAIKIPELQYTARLIKGNYDKYPVGSEVKVKLHFYLYGLLAEIVTI